MKPKLVLNEKPITITSEVVSIIDDQGKAIAKLSIHSGLVETELKPETVPSLGDVVRLTCWIEPQNQDYSHIEFKSQSKTNTKGTSHG